MICFYPLADLLGHFVGVAPAHAVRQHNATFRVIHVVPVVQLEGKKERKKKKKMPSVNKRTAFDVQ